MRELALHILDLIENSLRAGASRIEVTVDVQRENDRLRMMIEDNGSGLKVSPEAALNPFYTTKSGKRTGLGLSLLAGAAEATGGGLTIGKSEIGPVGVRVTAEFGLGHVDRVPLGDLGSTLAGIICTNPQVDFRIRVRCAGRALDLRVADLVRQLEATGPGELAVAQSVMDRVNAVVDKADVLT